MVEFTFPGEPVAAKRPRVTRNGSYTPADYRKYKKALAAALNAEYGYFAWDFPDPGSKDRSKWLKNNRYHLAIKIYRSANRGDVDNFLKTVQDALQDAGIIADDAQIDSVSAAKFIDREHPRMELKLEKVK